MPPNLQIVDWEESNKQNPKEMNMKDVLNQFQLTTKSDVFETAKKEELGITDFDEEARKLYEAMNLPVPKKGNRMTKASMPNCVYSHP